MQTLIKHNINVLLSLKDYSQKKESRNVEGGDFNKARLQPSPIPLRGGDSNPGPAPKARRRFRNRCTRPPSASPPWF